MALLSRPLLPLFSPFFASFLALSPALAQPATAVQPTPAPTDPPPAPPPATAAPVTDPSPALPPPALPGPRAAQFKASVEDALSARSADGNFSMRIGLQSEFRYEYSNHPDKTRDSAFNAQMIRPQIRGNAVAPWLRYFIQPELGGSGSLGGTGASRLLDFELDARPHDSFNVRVGQFLTPYSRSFFTPVPRLQFPDFSVVNTFFRADRDTGIMLFGLTPGAHLLEYDVGVFNGNRIDQGGNDDGKVVFVGRLAVNPLGPMDYDETAALHKNRDARLSIGVNAYSGEAVHNSATYDAATGKTTTTAVGTDKNTTAGADIAFSWERLTLLIEAHYRDATNLSFDKASNSFQGKKKKSQGAFVQAGVMLIDRALELGGRINFLDPDTDVSGDKQRVVEGQLAYYVHGNNLKVLGRYSNAHNEAASGVIPAGKTIHTMTLQTQLFF